MTLEATRPVRTLSTSTGSRFWAGLALAGAAGGTVALLPVPPGLRLVGVVALIVLGPGSLVRGVYRMDTAFSALVVPALGLATFTLVTAVMALAGRWHPVAAVAGLSLLVASGAALQWRAAGLAPPTSPPDDPDSHFDPHPDPGSPFRWRSVSVRPEARAILLLLVGACVAWAIALPSMRSASWTQFGLLAAASPLFGLSILLPAVAFGLSIHGRNTILAWASVIVSTLMMRLPTAMATEVPLYSWTYKHFGVVDRISQSGSLVPGVDIYNSWPGTFSFFAAIIDVTGTDLLTLARWFAPVFGLAFAYAVFVLALATRASALQAVVAAFIAQTVNWVGQDYLSPQAMAMVLAVAVLALIVRSPERAGFSWIAVFLFTAITVSHQLTPYWLLLVIAAFTVLRCIRPRWIVIAFAGIALGYLAWHLDVVNGYGDLLSFSPSSNAETQVRGATGSAGQALTAAAARLASLALWAMTALVLAWRVLLGPRLAAFRDAALAFSSILLLLGQSYGGEALYRVFLYSIPGSAVVIAPAVTAVLAGTWLQRHTRLRRTAAVAGATLATAGLATIALLSAQAYYGAWFPNLVSRDSYEASKRILEDADPHTLMIALAPGAPGRVVGRYTEFAEINHSFDTGIDKWPDWDQEAFHDTERVDEMTEQLLWSRTPTYVMVNDQMTWYSDFYGLFPTGAVQRLSDQLAANPHWETVERTPGLAVYRLRLDTADSHSSSPAPATSTEETS